MKNKQNWRSFLLKCLKKRVAVDSNSITLKDSDLLPLVLAATGFSPDSSSQLIVVPNQFVAETLFAGLKNWNTLLGCESPLPLYLFPENSLKTGEEIQNGNENSAQRSLILNRLLQKQPSLVIASVSSLNDPVWAPDEFQNNVFELKAGQTDIEPADLAHRLLSLDYDNEFEVHVPGEYTVRGGIVDLFTPSCKNPVRVEFFGDEIDEIRTFDSSSQRSLDVLQTVLVLPRNEVSPDEERAASLLDYCGDDVTRTFAFPGQIRNVLDAFEETVADKVEDAMQGAFVVYEELDTESSEENLFSAFSLSPLFKPDKDISEIYSHHHWRMLKSQLLRWHSDYQLIACVTRDAERERLLERFAEDEDLAAVKLQFEPFSIDAGIICPEAGLVLLSENELFDLTHRREMVALGSEVREFQSDWTIREDLDLYKGDYVVHARYGVAEFLGIREVEMDGEYREVMVLEYADEVKVYVPMFQVHFVSKYVGQGRGIPKLSSVGGTRWQKKVEQVGEGIREFASELLRIQAVRTTISGTKMDSDEEMQDAFEQTFPFDETDDQLQAIKEVKRDMESKVPMDRLLCGDVGYGKTEVAIRAAFKAVMNGMQVAVVTPTTVLAQQHFRSFSERMNAFPVELELLSRFRSAREQREALKKAKKGEVDIIIGTHRLLQKDVSFKNIGLVIIDEEQKFGVKHKEFLKQMRVEVDILTMSATPIPRTLHLSLTGARDLSTINTPPHQRQAIKTIVSQHDDNLIREAVKREMERKGQVFILHNRVKTIDQFAMKIKQLVPDANLAIGHGQMEAGELEQVMNRFINHEVDVLVSTTIIENGVDVPNANTIIIDRADRFGLAELYQIRGRVGRSHRQAYAYFIVPDQSILSHNARERMAAIKKFTHLGAGFKLALKDLEIRGAGNILGASQSGHIAAIGFELYCDMLKDTVNRLKNIPSEQRKLNETCAIRLPFISYRSHRHEADDDDVLSASIPPKYVNAENIRMECYKRLAKMRDEHQLDAFAEEIKDRFGRMPKSVKNLLELTRLEILALKRGIHAISMSYDKLMLETQNGMLKQKGRLPRVPDATPHKMMANVREIIEFFPERKS